MGRRAWLITWNKDKWVWENFAQKCVDTKAGKIVTESWSCANSNPQLGDEVFLIKLGEQPRGLIGHGTVARTIYEKTHFDVNKAAAGKTEKAIDVAFDQLINYEHEKIVFQKELMLKCGAQHWSPQNSGIEIKPEILEDLHDLWKSLLQIDDREEYWPYSEEFPVNLSEEQKLELARLEKEIDGLNVEGKDKLTLVKARINQGLFRENLIRRYKNCCLCNVKCPDLLIASHIKPWFESEGLERLDPDNGFLLCPNHDKLFDKGYITFSDDGMIMISSDLDETDRVFLNIRSDMELTLTEGNRKYLEYHRKNVFRDAVK